MTLSRRFGLFCIVSLLAANAVSNSSADELIYGVTDNSFLVSWDSGAPTDLLSGLSITGLANNEELIGIDYRPADNQLFGVGTSNQLYTISTLTGAATAVGPNFAIPLDGSAFGYDFNPVIDRSRIDTNTNNNYVINPNDGSQTQVTDVFYGAGDPNQSTNPNIAHIGYTNSNAGAVMTQLYAIDTNLDLLATQENSAGTLSTVGSLGINITVTGGFDISGATGTAYGAFVLAGQSESGFYSVDLGTGAATFLGNIDGGVVITAISVAPSAIPEPATGLVLVTLAGLAAVRRRR